VTAHPPFMLTLPDYGSTTRLLGLPLCTRCQNLPSLVRFGRTLRLLKKMWAVKYKKKCVAFTFNNRHRQPHPT